MIHSASSIKDSLSVIWLKAINWQNLKASPIQYTYIRPYGINYADIAMTYYFLRDDMLNWLNEYDAVYSIIWNEDSDKWGVKIEDSDIALLFKLTFYN